MDIRTLSIQTMTNKNREIYTCRFLGGRLSIKYEFDYDEFRDRYNKDKGLKNG